MQEKANYTEWIDKLKSNNNIVHVISSYLSLSRRGGTYWACCPFHHEKTPSFAVNEPGQFYHCFGCGESGDVIKFVSKMEGGSYWEGARILAERCGMELPKQNFDDEYIKKKKHRELLMQICREAAVFYHNSLMSPQGKKAMDYLSMRGVTNSTITRLGLGYSTNWTSLAFELKKKGFSREDILESGVCGEIDGKLFDEMGTRVIFPVIDHSGKVVGFSGRSMEKDARAKYKNTRQTPIFNKSSNIYCINFLRKARLEKNYAILVEGQMDVVALHQAGFENAIATMGTAFNQNHVSTLSRFVDSVIVCFDGDGAGQKATVKSLEPLLNEGFEIKVMELPEKLDPDEYIKKYGAESYQNLIDNSLPVYEFEIKYEAKKLDLKNRDNVSKFIDNSLKIVQTMKKESEKQIYIDLIANISKVPRETIARQLNSMRGKQVETAKTQTEIETQVVETKNYKAELFVLASVLHKKPYVHGVEIDDFVNNDFKMIYEYLQKNDFPIVSKLYDNFDVESNQNINKLINFDFDSVSSPSKEFDACLNTLELDTLISKQNQINAQIQTCTNEEVKFALIKRAGELSKEINEKKTLLNKVG